MAIYKQNIVDIDLGRGQIHRSFLNHSIGMYDQQADRFGIRVLRDGEAVDLTGITVQGVFMPPTGSPIAITGDDYTGVEGNVAEVILPQACYNYEGNFTLAIKLVDATNTVTGTMRIVDGVVDNTHASGTVAPTGSVPTYQEILAVYADMVAALVTVDELDDEVSDLKSALSEETRNLWEYGDLSGTKAVNKSFNFVSGKKYTISCKITSTYPGSSQNSRISLTNNSTSEKAMGTITHDGTRHSCTITAVEDCTKIYFYAANTSSNSTGYTVSVSDIQIEEGETMTAYVPHVTATDFEARNGVSENATEIGIITEAGGNLWTYGDLSGTKAVNKAFNFTEGQTYTISCKITSSDTTYEYSRICMMDDSTHEKVYATMKHDGARHSVTMTATADCTRLYFYASNTGSHSESKTISVTDIQVETGDTATPFMPENVTAIDYVARGQLEKNNEVSSVELLAENETYETSEESQTITFKCPLHDASFGDPVAFCDAMFTRESGVTDYPRCRLEIANNRSMTRYSTWYKVGSEGEYRFTEWRAPAYIWEKRKTTVKIVIPVGCTLTIRKLGVRFDTNIDRTNARGITFFARPGTCNMVPELSAPALQMAYRHGYDAFTVIPKISSDGQWFAYHDDKWIETGDGKTLFVNPDGSAIEEDEYNNKYFHEIPFSYLDQFRTGSFGNLFLSTRFLKLEDCCEFLAKTGMKLRFSMHPATGINTIAKLGNLKRLVQKYGLLKDLSIIVNDITSIFPVFGNDIGCYCFPNANGSSWEEGAEKPVNSGFVAAQAAKTTYGITVPINCGLWEDSLFSNKVAAENLVSDILDAGFTAGAFNDTITGIDGSEHNYCWSEDFRWLMSIGITEFTEGYNTSVGLNW